MSYKYSDLVGYGYDYNKNFIKHAKLNNPNINFDYLDRTQKNLLI